MSRGKRLSVCMLIDAWFPFVGGGQVHVKNLIKYLEVEEPVKVTLFHSPHHHVLIRALWTLWVIPQVVAHHLKAPFQLIHAHAFAAGLPGKTLSSLLRLPVVYTVHGSHLMDTKTRGVKAWGERFLLTKISYSHQISVTRSFAKYDNVNKNISIIRNGADIEAFNKVKAKKNKQFTLLYVGRDHPTKGLPILRQAFAQVKNQYPKIKLKLVTHGKITGKALIKEYKKAHAFILPSLVEGQPIAILEAWAAKLPVIATRTAGVKEIATHGKNALLIAPDNINALKKAITKLMKMKVSQRDKLTASGYKGVKQKYTWRHIAGQTYHIYLEVKKKHRQ